VLNIQALVIKQTVKQFANICDFDEIWQRLNAYKNKLCPCVLNKFIYS